jgi:superfamily II DNA or RNA helicase
MPLWIKREQAHGVIIEDGKILLKRWITIHPHGKGAVNKYGDSDYRRIEIDVNGIVTKGPKQAVGKPIHDAFRQQGKPQPHLSRSLNDIGVEHTMTLTPNGHHEYTIGEGVKSDLDKFGRKTTKRGTVLFTDTVFKLRNWGDGQWVELKSNFDDKDALKSMGARFDGNSKTWNIPLKDIPNVAKHFKHASIQSGAVKAYEELLSQSPPELNQPKKQVEIKQEGKPSVTFEAKPETQTWNGKMPADMQHTNLYAYQKAGVEFLLHHKKAILGYAVGLGKTPTAITAANVAMDEGKVNRFAVIAPSSVKFQWKSEIEKFSGRKAVVLDNSTPKRLAQSFEDAKSADYVVANYEMLRNPEYADKIKELAGDAVIADEGHKIKNDSQQTKSWRETFANAKYRWLLTATPFPNGQPKETYTMLSHVAADKVGSWNQFSRDHAVMQSVHTPRGKIMKPVALKNQAVLREKVKDAVILRHHNSPDVTNTLPSARHVTHTISMNKDQAKVYSAMRDSLMHELDEMDNEKFKQNAANILTKMQRLEQIAIDPDQLDPEHADMNKLYPKEQWAVDTTMDHLENGDNRGMVIFSNTKMPIEKVRRGLIESGLSPNEIGVISGDVDPAKRKEVADRFGEGKIKVVLSTSAGEEGINLQHGGHTMIHLDTPWVPKSITQREGRVLRTGQPSDYTLFYSPVMSDSIEEMKRGKLAAKVDDIEKLLGEGSAGSVSENIGSTAKAWTLQDMKEMLGATPKAKTTAKKSAWIENGILLIKRVR